jgi:hypothetical protein
VVNRNDLHAFVVHCDGHDRVPGALAALIAALDPQRR